MAGRHPGSSVPLGHARGSSALIQELGAGDVLGWSWLFPPYYWHFDARALEPSQAIFFYGTRLREHCEQDHDLGYALLKRVTDVVIRRLQSTRRLLILDTAASLSRGKGFSPADSKRSRG